MSEYIYEHKPSGADHMGKPVEIPTLVQREEIVRCRDCLSWHKGYCYKHAYEVANEYGDTFTEGVFPMDDSDFCSRGEGREP